MATATEALFCGKDKFVKWEAYWCRRVITEILWKIKFHAFTSRVRHGQNGIEILTNT